MDPLSITAGILTILSGISASFRGIRRVVNVSEDVECLVNEIIDLIAVFSEVQTVLQNSSHPPSSALLETLLSSRTKISLFHDLVSDRLWKTQSGPINMARLRLAWLKEKSKIIKYRDEFKSMRSNLTLVLVSLNM